MSARIAATVLFVLNIKKNKKRNYDDLVERSVLFGRINNAFKYTKIFIASPNCEP